MLPIYDASSYSVLPIKDLLNTPNLYIHLALKAVGESGVLLYVEGQSSEFYIAMGFHNHRLKACAKFGQKNKCGEAGEIVVSVWFCWYHLSTIISSLPAAWASTDNWPNHQLTFMAGNVQLSPAILDCVFCGLYWFRKASGTASSLPWPETDWTCSWIRMLAAS